MERNYRLQSVIILLCYLMVFVQCQKEDTPTEDPPDTVNRIQTHVIQVSTSGASFIDMRTGDVFTPRGANYFNIVSTADGFQDRFFHRQHFKLNEIRARLNSLRAAGYNTIRVFLDTCNDDPDCIGNLNGTGLNLSYLNNIAALMNMAIEEDMFLLLTSNDLPDQGGYWELSNQGATDQIDGYRNSHYITSSGVAAAARYWEDLLEGLLKQNADFSHVLAWSILNEQWYFGNAPPFNLPSGTVSAANGKLYDLSQAESKKQLAEESILYYVQEIKKTILSFDPNALVTMGIFAPNSPNTWRPGDFKYVESSLLVNDDVLDFLDLHLYPGTSTFEKLWANFDVQDPTRKPMIMGEVGAFVDIYRDVDQATVALQNWIATSCDYGFDGWLIWGLDRAPIAIGDATWSLSDDQNHLRDALSPRRFPDPCTEEWLGKKNIALNTSISASKSLSGESPSAAVDGDLSTQWGSGDDPPQWIELDLGSINAISEIALVVAQFPKGMTIHTIWTKQTSSDDFTKLTDFVGDSEEGDRLSWTGVIEARYIKIETSSSPSWVAWKEIEVY